MFANSKKSKNRFQSKALEKYTRRLLNDVLHIICIHIYTNTCVYIHAISIYIYMYYIYVCVLYVCMYSTYIYTLYIYVLYIYIYVCTLYIYVKYTGSIYYVYYNIDI